MPGQTIAVALRGPSSTATFTIPPSLVPFVDSVYANIDNTAGGTATPTLTIKGPNGRTVAAVAQDATIPGGEANGRVTWASGLPAKPATGGGVTTTLAQYSGAVTTIAAGDTDFLTWDTLDAGTELFDHTFPKVPSALVTGVYSVSLVVQVSALSAGTNAYVTLAFVHPAVTGQGLQIIYADDLAVGFKTLNATWELDAGDGIYVTVSNNDSVSRDFNIFPAQVLRLS